MASARTAQAAESPGLNWVRLDGAQDCLSSAELAAAVNARVGKSVFEAPDHARLLVEGHVLRAGAAWKVTLDLVDVAGTRVGRRQLSFSGESCHAIDASVTLVIAVMLYPNTKLIDSGGALEPGTVASFDRLFAGEPSEIDAASLPALAPPVVTHAPSSHDTPAEVPVASEPAPTHKTPFAFSVGALLGTGQLPGLNIAGALYAWLQLDALWPIEVSASLFAANTLPIGPRARVRFSAWSTELRICPLRLDWPTPLYVCGGGALGSVQSTPSDFVDLQSPAQDLIAIVQAALVTRWRLASVLHMRAALVVATPVIRRTYTYRDELGRDAQLFRAAPLTAQIEIGVGL